MHAWNGDDGFGKTGETMVATTVWPTYLRGSRERQ